MESNIRRAEYYKAKKACLRFDRIKGDSNVQLKNQDLTGVVMKIISSRFSTHLQDLSCLS